MRSRSKMPAMFVLTALATVLSAAPAMTDPSDYYTRRGTFLVGGGINSPVGETQTYLNSGGTIFFGGGLNFRRRFALQVEYTHNWQSIAPDVIDHAQSDSTFTDVSARLWSLALNGVLRFNVDNHYVPWVTAGAGYYKRNLELAHGAQVYYPPVWDPYWGWIDGGWVPGEAIVGQRSATGPGFNVGFGIDFKIEGSANVFFEARYHHATLDGVDMQLIPVMVGFRW